MVLGENLLSNKPSEVHKPNRLIYERSPYLLQHAYNPVDWYSWSTEAFEKARAEDKPVFVSIGYSTCHWCHVMEEECFNDVKVAELLNDAFICIKVDREERPDLDGAYMAVCQAMGRNCGWPLNVLMTPSKQPFFVTSYIPKENRYGLVGMLDFIPQVKEAWKTQRNNLEKASIEVIQRLIEQEARAPEEAFDKDAFAMAYEQLTMRFDPENGGFGEAPKFPMPHYLLFLLRYWSKTKDKNALSMAEKTLEAMRFGGVFDQIGFGFHRYSTDAYWLVPHFEKMLYDQALLSLAYTEAYQATGKETFKKTSIDTLEYVLRELLSPKGGFYSAEDADSEGKEGKFYLWTEKEIRQALSEDTNWAIQVFGVKTQGNYYESHGGRNGENILHLTNPLQQSEMNPYSPMNDSRFEGIRKMLFLTRQKRVHPFKDDKILVDWNGLMIAALARASIVFNEPKYLQAAKNAADFILQNMMGADGAVYHRFAKGERAVEAFLDDYAFLTFGLIEIYEACFEEKYLQKSLDLTKILFERFWDKTAGGFYFSTDNSKETIPRMKQIYDNAIPSGNSVSLYNLLRLAQISNESDFWIYADKILKALSREVNSQPTAFTFLLCGADFAFGPGFNVTLVGDINGLDSQDMLKVIRKGYLPNMVVTFKHETAKEQALGYRKIDGKVTAYICRDKTCLPPTNGIEMVEQILKQS